MRLFKVLLTLVILFLIAIFVYQNLQTWRQPVSFRLDLYFFQAGPGVALYSVILLSALAGFIIGILLLLRPYFRTRRLLKRERQEKKQALEGVTLKQVPTESPGEAADPSA